VAYAVGIKACAHLLRDQIDAVVLEILGHARHEGYANCGGQEPTHAPYELGAGVLAVLGGVVIDDEAEDPRIQQ
jgi:hypothetical protein